MNSEHFIRGLLKEADIKINGPRPSDIRVKNNNFFLRVFHDGSLGLGESYMEGWWESDDLEETMFRILRVNIPYKILNSPILFLATAFRMLGGRLGIAGAHSTAFEVGKRHYDLGNDLYTKMLDSRMNYSCGYWKKAQTLDEAQEAKLDLTCKKLGLKPGMRLLDIGCGWGGLLIFAAEKYKVSGVGITVSAEQATLARKHTHGLSIEIYETDYRDFTSKQFDRIVSIGMFEHVGYRHYKTFMKKVHSLLVNDGIFLLQTIGTNEPSVQFDRWFERYIFPHSLMPSISQTEAAFRPLFTLEDFQNFGPYYVPTIRAWFENFNRAWPELKEKYDERFYRMWEFYLLSSAAAFRARSLQLWQFVFRKRGTEGVYNSVR